MKFVYSRWQPNIYEERTCYLEDRNWNDFGNYTTYFLYYCIKNVIEFIGEVKILNKLGSNTSIYLKDQFFINLGEDYVSLGQSREYYENLGCLTYEEREEILKGLRDYSKLKLEEKQEFRNLVGFEYSLLREWTAAYLLENIDNIIENKRHTLNQMRYTYKTKLENAESEHEIDFNFTPKDILPYRNFILIGKNGVGKTKVLENLIEDIINEKTEAFIIESDTNRIPNYSNIILFYYGNDLEFEKLKNYKGKKLKTIDIKESSDLEMELECIKKKNRDEYLKRLLRDLLEEKINESMIPTERLSSGQKVIYRLLIQILVNIDEGTLIVIDEPETHLHPNIIGRLMTFIRGILEDFISHSIMSTHSPIILQQTLSRSVRLLEREGNYPLVSPLDMECFGENLTTITNDIFNVADYEDDYKIVLKKLSLKKEKKEDAMKLFEKELSFNATMYLKTLYNEKEEANEEI